MSGNCLKRASFPAVCSRKVSSTRKPRVASRIAGLSASLRDVVPNLSSAASQVASVPGTPTDSPEETTSENG